MPHSRALYDKRGVDIFVCPFKFLPFKMGDLAVGCAGVASVGATGAHVCLCVRDVVSRTRPWPFITHNLG